FIVARSYADGAGTPMEGYITGLVALMELGILVALFYGRLALARVEGRATTGLHTILSETLRGRGLLLLGGGLIMGAAIGEKNFERIEPFFVDLFRGVLVLFLLEMGMTAARHLREFAAVGLRMLAFGLAMPLINGTIASLLATFAGLPIGSAFVIGAVAASASYIDAPAAVRATFPTANPSIYLTSSLGITFPFMLILGVPIIYQITLFWQALLP
ncbi:MAG: sodium-dependent bicarbonate transport family permease, partial [Paracoccaceae bacterium]